MKLLVKKKDGKVHIRTKSEESAENIEEVHPNKINTWAAFGEAASSAFGGTMEDVIQSVIDEMRGVAFKADKQPLPVTQEDYEGLMFQAAKKGISKAMLDALVVIAAKKMPTIEEQVKEFIRNRN